MLVLNAIFRIQSRLELSLNLKPREHSILTCLLIDGLRILLRFPSFASALVRARHVAGPQSAE